MKLNEKIEKVNDNFSVYMYDNGFMLEISGRDDNGSPLRARLRATAVPSACSSACTRGAP